MALKSFLKRFQLEYMTGVLKETSARFPLSVLCCAAGTALCMLETHDSGLLTDDAMQRTLLFLSYGLAFFTEARLFAEGRGLPRARELAMCLAGGAILLALAFVPAHFSTMHAFTGAALALGMLFAPYIGREAAEDSFWYYNYQNGIGLAVAGISTAVLCTGVCAIVGSMDYLLYDMKLSKLLYADIWIFGGLFFGPVAFMKQVPRQFDFAKDECTLLPGIHFIANFLLTPLVLVYMWVLYVYFLKIAASWELPKGNLAYMVTGFGSAGVAARLAVFPMRETGTKLLRQFYRYFFPILVVPLLLLALGLYTRLSQYGVTEDRYAIGICLAWLSALAAWNVMRPAAAHIKHAPMVLALLLLAGAAGPWSAGAVSTRSQMARLETLLGKAGVIAEGKMRRAPHEVPFGTRKDISGILDYMFKGKENAIVPFLRPFRAEIAKAYKDDSQKGIPTCGKSSFIYCWELYSMPEKVMQAWGMTYVSQWSSVESQYVTIRMSQGDWAYGGVMKVSPYTHMAVISGYVWQSPYSSERPYGAGADAPKATFAVDMAGKVTLALSDGRSTAFETQQLVDALYAEKLTEVPAESRGRLVIRGSNPALPAELRIDTISGNALAGHVKISQVTGIILFSP